MFTMVTMTKKLLKLKLRITGINSGSCDKSNIKLESYNLRYG